MPPSGNKIKKAPARLSRSVVLVGLMGAGKTTVGKRLATLLALPFVDSDNEIVEAAGCSIADIFEIYGETLFRDLEKRVMLRLLASGPAVIATGGGAYVNPDTRAAVKERAICVWLKADLEVLVERVSRRETRPLLKTGDKREILGRLMQDRYPVYCEADITIDSSASTHETVVEQVAEALAAWQKAHD